MLQAQGPFQLLPVEADHHFLAGFATDDGDGCGHRPHALELRHGLLVLGYVPDGGLHALLAEELLRPVAEQSAGLLHEQHDIVRYYFARQRNTPLASSPSANLSEDISLY